MSDIALLERWYRRHSRPLPWRLNHDPYRIWISEVMLQQTQATAVIPYYERFLTAFPSVSALALAEQSSVLGLWAGLGYYSRARNLRTAAIFVMEKWDGRFPTDRKQMLEIPGVGPYTAGAILSIAFDLAVPIVDGNVERVFSRFFGIRHPIDSPKVQKKLWTLAEDWVHKAKSPRNLNQALMELGALVCRKSAPKCRLCPISENCFARKRQIQHKLPIRKRGPSVKRLRWTTFVIVHRGKYLVRQNCRGEWWKDLWDFPRIEAAPSQLPKFAKDPIPLSKQKHTVTHHRIEVTPWLVPVRKRPPGKLWAGRWVSHVELRRLPMSSLARKILTNL